MARFFKQSALLLGALAAVVLLNSACQCGADELLVGAATVSITPSEPVALAGQMRTRIADKVQSECLASRLSCSKRVRAKNP